MARHEPDDHLQSLYLELRTLMSALNRLHHPVYPGDPERIAQLEHDIAEIRKTIQERRRALTASA
ncbi:MAG: hypothetical protein EA401_03635 [Planctomycetota bacterium]|nr:MAG: hypothetical protein EA401_03635 [Planctomycetota bacterium]